MKNKEPKTLPNLPNFLNTKPLYYKEIDHERIHHAYERLSPHIRRPKTIHIVGTNGKGSTGRMIAHLAWQGENGEGLRVGHYTSPHIIRFNERIWHNGHDTTDATLEAAHERLYAILGRKMSEGLSYFEYTTLLAFVVFEKCDLMVLEAGLGGEYDATNVCPKELSVFTPIGIDHQAFFGETIDEIAATKLRSMQPGGQALIALQPYPETLEVAKAIAKERETALFFAEKKFDEHFDGGVGVGVPRPTGLATWPKFLIENAGVAMQALDILNIPYDPQSLLSVELFGRYYPLRENIRIDVGHNPLAARALVEVMEPDTVLIYNSLDDKDYQAVLLTLQPKLKRIEIIPIDSQRAATRGAIETAVAETGLPYRTFDGTIDPEEHYLVFGSFYVVEAMLNRVGRG